MRKHSLLFLSLLVPAVFVLGEYAVVQAQQKASSTASPKRWSDAATWPDKKVPAKDAVVTIGTEMNVILDVSPAPLNGLRINGKLSFADNKDLELTTEWIMMHGELEIGTAAKPHTRNATITLTQNVPDENIDEMGDRGIMMMGGKLSLHGNRKDSWTKLAKTAAKGSKTIDVLNAGDWKKGDMIVVASTDFDPHQAERRTIASVSGKTITLDQPLEFMHFGQVTFGVDERAEVGMLSRNIKIQASADADKSFSGGHIMAMVGSTMQVSGIELTRMGQHENLARYPIHWHLVDEGQGQYIQNSAIHDTYSRCVTVHGTNNVRVQNNVAYNNVGHCYFLEDGVEHGNQYLSNLGILTRCHTSRPCNSTNAVYTGGGRGANGQQAKDQLIPSDNTAATFWITNPDNTYIGNVSAGSEATGFWMAFPEHPTGKFEGTEIAAKTWPRRTQIREFSGNVSHSNVEGFMFDRGTNNAGTFNLGGNTHMVYENPQDRNSKQLESTIKDFTIYKSKGAAIWARGEHHIFDGLKIADSAIGYTHAYPGGSPGGAVYTSKVINSLFVGESDNKGTPKTEAEVKYGRTLPRVDADYPVRGFEYYDFTHHVVNTKFVNFQDNDTRKSGAISYLLYTSFPISTANSIEKITFDNAKPAYFPPADARFQFSGEFGRFVGWNGAVFHDKDGSATGKPNSYVVIDNGVVWDEKRCERKPTWNAVACTGDMGRMGIAAGGGAARGGPGTVGVAITPGGGPGGPGAAKGAPGGPVAAGGPGGPGAAKGLPGGPGGPGAAKGAPGGPVAAGGPGGPGAAKGGPGGPGAAKGGGGFGGGGGGAQTVLVRGDRRLTLSGDVTVLSGTEIRAESEAPTLTVRISEMEAGSWMMVELPGFTTAAAGDAKTSLDALRSATTTSYFKGDGALWVKVVSAGNSGVAAGQGPGGRGGGGGGGGSITVSKDAAPVTAAGR